MSVVQITPTQLPQHFQENNNGSTSPVYQFNGNLYIFMTDDVGFGSFGGSTAQFFVYKSADNGATWSNITPGSPVYLEQRDGQIWTRSGNIVFAQYIQVGVTPQLIQLLPFNLATETWGSLSPTLGGASFANGIAGGGMQAAVRPNGQIVLCAANAIGNPNGLLNVMVYDPGSNTWVFGPSSITFIGQIVGGGIDSTGLAHFFVVQWTGSAPGGGNASLQHFTVTAGNAISGFDLVFSFTHPPNATFPQFEVSEPVFYLDVVSTQRRISIAVCTPDAFHNDVGLDVVTGVEGATPVWSATSVPTAEDFTTVTLNNSGVTAMFIPSLLPVQLTAQTQLHIFWTATGQNLAPGSSPWNNYLRHMSLTNGSFSAITTEFQSLNTKITPGSLYPILLSNNGSVALVGGYFPTIDYALFLSLMTKYSSLAQWFLTYNAVGPGSPLTLSCGSPPPGTPGVPYSSTMVAAGGTPPYTFALTAGALPDGLNLDTSTGVISGIPTVPGTFGFSVQVTDSLLATASVSCSISIIAAPLSVPPPMGLVAGGMGCVPHCYSSCPPRGVESVSGLGEFVGGGDPVMIARLALSLCMLAVQGH